MKLQTIIGLEFHVQLNTKTKMFCACKNKFAATKPNQHVCPICLGHPGTLPTLNKEALRLGIKASLALECKVADFIKFDRKNYFYPDLPKGYQISQYDKPLASEGRLIINFKATDGLAGSLTDEDDLKEIRVLRLHLEEDSGKSLHEKNKSLIDFNRGGAPLIEIVTYPDMRSPHEAKTFARELQLIMKQLNISEANMELGQLRCDANISLRPEGDNKLYPKTEIKNINSFNALEKALEFEIKRQSVLWKNNTPPELEQTRGWNEKLQETVAQRDKEAEADYRYFPEPDIPPLNIAPEDVAEIKQTLPELPQMKRRRFIDEYEFTPVNAKILSSDTILADYAEQVISELKNWLQHVESGTAEEIWNKNKKKLAKLVADWLINKLIPLLDELKIKFKDNKITAENFAEFITLIFKNKINSSAAQIILPEMAKTGADPSHVMDEKDLSQIDNNKELEKIAKQVIDAHPEQADEYRAGKEPLIKFFLGAVMKKTQGKANPQKTEKLLEKLLNK